MKLEILKQGHDRIVAVRLLALPVRTAGLDYINNVYGLVLFDDQNNLVGLRILPRDSEGNNLALPAAMSCDFPMGNGVLRQNPDFIGIGFDKNVKSSSFTELDFLLYVFEGRLHSVGFNLGTFNFGLKYIAPFME